MFVRNILSGFLIVCIMSIAFQAEIRPEETDSEKVEIMFDDRSSDADLYEIQKRARFSPKISLFMPLGTYMHKNYGNYPVYGFELDFPKRGKRLGYKFEMDYIDITRDDNDDYYDYRLIAVPLWYSIIKRKKIMRANEYSSLWSVIGCGIGAVLGRETSKIKYNGVYYDYSICKTFSNIFSPGIQILSGIEGNHFNINIRIRLHSKYNIDTSCFGVSLGYFL